MGIDVSFQTALPGALDVRHMVGFGTFDRQTHDYSLQIPVQGLVIVEILATIRTPTSYTSIVFNAAAAVRVTSIADHRGLVHHVVANRAKEMVQLVSRLENEDPRIESHCPVETFQ